MMKKVMMSAAVAASMVLSACASLPDDATRQAADYGPYPTDYQAIIADYHEGVMKDPQSVQIKFVGGPSKGYKPTNAFSSTGTYGYIVCAMVNAKNSYGGYTGAKLTGVFIRDGRVLYYQAATDDVANGMVKAMCKTAIAEGVK